MCACVSVCVFARACACDKLSYERSKAAHAHGTYPAAANEKLRP